MASERDIEGWVMQLAGAITELQKLERRDPTRKHATTTSLERDIAIKNIFDAVINLTTTLLVDIHRIADATEAICGEMREGKRKK